MMKSFEDELKQALDQKADSLDSATLSRLHRARVLATETQKPWWQNPMAYIAVTASSAALVAYLLLTQPAMEPAIIDAAISSDPLEIMEIMELEVDLELVEELEFYHWLEQSLEQETDA